MQKSQNHTAQGQPLEYARFPGGALEGERKGVGVAEGFATLGRE